MHTQRKPCTPTAPVVSYTALDNGPTTGGSILTVVGVSFLTIDATPTLDIAAQSCSTATWASKTSVACRLSRSPAVGLSIDIYITSSALDGTCTGRFTFDGRSTSLTLPYAAAPTPAPGKPPW